MNLKTPAMFVGKRKSYAELLSTSDWERFRKRVLDANGHFCKVCQRSNVTVQVHHIAYEQGRKPWEYGTDEVMVLCVQCHQAMHEELKKFRKFVFDKLEPQTFRVINAALCVALTQYDRLTFAHALAEFVASPRMVQNYANAWGVSAVTGRQSL